MNISIIIATGKRDRLLSRLLQELRQQSYPALEVIIVVGPGSPATLATLENIPCDLKTVTCPTENIARARNMGVQRASGEIVGFIDDDGIPASRDWARTFSWFFRQDKARRYAAAGGPVYYRDSGSLEFHSANNTINDYGQFPVPGIDMNKALVSNRWVLRVPGCNAFFRRESLERIGGFDEAYRYYHEETDICFRLNGIGMKTAFVEDGQVKHYDAKEQRPLLYRRPWRNIACSDTYYCMKNALDRLPERMAKTLRSLPLRHYVRELQIAEKNGLCPSSDGRRIRGLLVKGWAAGLFAGLLKPRSLAHFEGQGGHFKDFRKPAK